MTEYNTSIYSNMLRNIKSPEQFRAERQQVEASELTNALNRQKVDAYTKEQNLLNTFRTARQRGASADELVGMGDYEGAKDRQTFETNKVDESRKAEKWTQEKAKFVLGVQKDLAGRVLANPTGQEAMAAIAEMERLTSQNMDSERQRVAMFSTPEQFRQWAAGHAMEADKLLPKFDEVNLGGSVQTRMINPLTGKATVTATDAVTPTPGQVVAASREARIASGVPARASSGAAPAKAPGATAGAPAGAPAMPKLTESQAKATTFLGQMRSAQKTLTDLGADKAGFLNQVGISAAGGKANIAAPAKAQQIKQAQNQWSESFLRFKTGAAATKEEIELNNRTYFPQIGDSQDVINQKRAARLQTERDMEAPAGPGAGTLSTPRNADRKVVRTGTHNGRKVVQYSDGSTDYAD